MISNEKTSIEVDRIIYGMWGNIDHVENGELRITERINALNFLVERKWDEETEKHSR